jgi:hypothetical protein
MRYTAKKDSQILKRASMGPAAISAALNRGLAQRKFVPNTGHMVRGGSMGQQSLSGFGNRAERTSGSLSCLCGPGDPGFGALAVPAVVKVGPIAARMMQLRANGATATQAYKDAMLRLYAQGHTKVTPQIHLQLAAGLQPMGSSSLGAFGLAPIVGAGVTGGSIAGSSVGTAAAGAVGVGGGIALGQTVIPIPVVGAVVGLVAFEAYNLTRRKVGAAEAVWTSQSFLNSLKTTPGSAYTDNSFSEAFKGMMDTNGTLFTCCGADRHKDPDQFMQPLAAAIVNGYMAGAVPLTATTAQVFNNILIPWIQGGASGLMTNASTVNWLLTNPNAAPGRLMIQAAADKYLAGQAMTRGDMPAYGNQGLHTPTLVQALTPWLQAQTPTTNTPTTQTQPGVQPAVTPGDVAPVPVGVAPVNPTNVPVPPIPTPSYPDPVGGAAVGYTYPPAPPVSYPAATSALPAATTASVGGGLPTWAMLAIAAVGVGFLFFKSGPVTTPPNV